MLADFPQAAALGFQSAAQTPSVNPLGQFVRNMLAEHQQKRNIGTEIGAKVGLEAFKSSLDIQAEQAKEQREQNSPLYKAQVENYGSLSTERQKKTPQERALDALEAGQPLPGLSMEDTKKMAIRSPMSLYDLVSEFSGGNGGENKPPSSTIPKQPAPPKYDKNKEKLLMRTVNGKVEYKVVPK